ncbi:MAG: phosphate signaling complex protein PhoU [Verrucomicrobia bacterium]|nr:phosphate signaling complex protein PhoU [Verrucomicrobiota bacterium]
MQDRRATLMEELKEKLLTMASHAEAAVNQSVRALLRRDDDLAMQTKAQDAVIDRWQMAIDESAMALLGRGLARAEVRLVAVAMKIAQNLERVGDEATTISRRCLALGHDPQLRQSAEVPAMAQMVLQMLKVSLDAFVRHDPDGARALIPRDAEVDALHRRHSRELTAYMAQHPAAVERCLDLLVVFKSLERIADHAKNIAEEVVYAYAGEDIRHTPARSPAGNGTGGSPRGGEIPAPGAPFYENPNPDCGR